MRLCITVLVMIGAAALMPIETSAQNTRRACNMNITFNTEQSAEDWRTINDGVMGGRSSGGPRFDAEHMIFEGVINTNGGGFSSVRTDVEAGVLSRASGVSLRVKSDGRTYKVTFRTDTKRGFRPISFQTEIPQTPIGDWAEVRVSFDDLRASIFGRPVTGVFDKSKVRELGIIIADGQDGPFKLEVDWIKACEE